MKSIEYKYEDVEWDSGLKEGETIVIWRRRTKRNIYFISEWKTMCWKGLVVQEDVGRLSFLGFSPNFV